jgi:hypothetical protein
MDLQTDIAVIGAGVGSGCRVAAAEKELRLLSLRIGAGLVRPHMFAEGPFAADSPYKKDWV